MSRRGGLQAKTLAMYNRLDQLSQEWVSASELAFYLCEEFGRTYPHALRVVKDWATNRKDRVRESPVARMPFYCTRSGAALDVGVLAGQFWGSLPERFRKDHRGILELPLEERIHGVLMAYGYLCLERSDCRTAFNAWAESHKLRLIQKTFASQKT